MARQLIVCLFLLASNAHADCVDRAAARFHLNADLLRAMAEQESYNDPGALGPLLSDGNRAIGQWQINTIHLPELARYGVTRADLMTECGSAFVGAWYLARYIALVGPTWHALGVYNTGPASKNIEAQRRYEAAVKRRFERIRRARRNAPSFASVPSRAMSVWRAE